jgi:hypothetical protein
MLEVSTLAKESELGVDFAEIYHRSALFRCWPSTPVMWQLVPLLAPQQLSSKVVFFMGPKWSPAHDLHDLDVTSLSSLKSLEP